MSGKYVLTPERYEAVLDWVEEVSGNRLTTIPAGYPGQPTLCPLARATGFVIGGTTYWQPGDKSRRLLPLDISEFRRAFDTREITNADLKAGGS